jgi:cation:H+ antiporter
LIIAGVFWLVAGFALLVLGSEWVIRAAARVAAALGITPMVIGLTVVSVGTSVPELAVGITASLQGSGSLAVANISGTNLFNLLFILCLSAAIRSLPIALQVFKLDLPAMVVAALLLLWMAGDGQLSQLEGAVMVAAAVVYTLALIRITRREAPAVKEEFSEEYGIKPNGAGVRARDVAMLIAGIAMNVIGADWLVDGAVTLARALQVPETVIGLTIVSAGTSAPELVTTVIGTLRNERDVAVGNLLGSSIYNILIILGLTCAVSPSGVPVEHNLVTVDLPVMCAAVVLALPVFWTGRRVSRLEGWLGIAVYCSYLFYLIRFRS